MAINARKGARLHPSSGEYELKSQRAPTIILLKWLKWEGQTMPRAGEGLARKRSHGASGGVHWHKHSGRMLGNAGKATF